MNARSQLVDYGKTFESHVTLTELVAFLREDVVTEAEAPRRIHG